MPGKRRFNTVYRLVQSALQMRVNANFTLHLSLKCNIAQRTQAMYSRADTRFALAVQSQQWDALVKISDLICEGPGNVYGPVQG